MFRVYRTHSFAFLPSDDQERFLVFEPVFSERYTFFERHIRRDDYLKGNLVVSPLTHIDGRVSALDMAYKLVISIVFLSYQMEISDRFRIDIKRDTIFRSINPYGKSVSCNIGYYKSRFRYPMADLRYPSLKRYRRAVASLFSVSVLPFLCVLGPGILFGANFDMVRFAMKSSDVVRYNRKTIDRYLKYFDIEDK